MTSYPVLNVWRPPIQQLRGPQLGQDVMGRVEVRDAQTGAFIKDASVVLTGPAGATAQATDEGGNVTIDRSDYFAATRASIPTGVSYRISAEGYATQERPFVIGQFETFDMVPTPTQDVQPTVPGGEPEPPSGEAEIPWGWIAGGIGAAVLIAVVAS